MTPRSFLADESCDFGVVRALRQAGHDVIAVAERESRSVDEALIEEAVRDARILITEDKDFGWLAFVKGVRAGVVLIGNRINAQGGDEFP